MADRLNEHQNLTDAYRAVQERMQEALIRSGRRAEDAILIAVSSEAPPESIRHLLGLGHCDFGETQPQQLAQRVVAIEEYLGRQRFLTRRPAQSNGTGGQDAGHAVPAVRWHMVGPLARNKAKLFARWTRLIHQLDTLRLAEELHTLGGKLDRAQEPKPLEVLLKVNLSGDPEAPGVIPPAVIHVARQVDTMVHLQLRGISVDAPEGLSGIERERLFANARELFDELGEQNLANGRFNLFSMGRSDDFEDALKYGSNLVRIGRAIFGRNPVAVS